MKTAKDWIKEKKAFKLDEEEFIMLIQKDAHNSGVLEVSKKVTLNTGSRQFKTYSPSGGMKTIEIDQTSILKCLHR